MTMRRTDDGVYRPKLRRSRLGLGFSLIELMIVVAIIAILAAIALPSYTRHVVKTRRVAAEGCLMEQASYMERFYATNLRYDQDQDDNATELPDLDCKSAQQTGEYYTYRFAADSLSSTKYKIEAVPQGAQASADTECGTVSITETGTRGAGGSDCW